MTPSLRHEHRLHAMNDGARSEADEEKLIPTHGAFILSRRQLIRRVQVTGMATLEDPVAEQRLFAAVHARRDCGRQDLPAGLRSRLNRLRYRQRSFETGACLFVITLEFEPFPE